MICYVCDRQASSWCGLCERYICKEHNATTPEHHFLCMSLMHLFASSEIHCTTCWENCKKSIELRKELHEKEAKERWREAEIQQQKEDKNQKSFESGCFLVIIIVIGILFLVLYEIYALRR